MSEKRTLNDIIKAERKKAIDSVVVELYYKPEFEPKDMKTADKNIRKFISAVEKATNKKIKCYDRFYVFFKDLTGLRSVVWLKNVTAREAETFNIKKCWKKGRLLYDVISDDENERVEKVFEKLIARPIKDA